MAKFLPEWFVTDYQNRVFTAYQRKLSLLKGRVTLADVVGSKASTPKIGKAAAGKKDRDGLVPVQNVPQSTVEWDMEDWYSGRWQDKLDAQKTTRETMANLANAGAWALARKTDQLIVTAALASLPGAQKTDATGGMTRTKIAQALEILDEADVPADGMRFALVGPHQWSELSFMQEFSNSQWVNDLTMENGRFEAKRWNGTVWVNSQSLLTEFKSGNIRPCLMFHASAIAWGNNSDIEADFTWHGDRAAWFINHMMSGGAKRIDDAGVVEIGCDDTTELEPTP